jgi:hypothetical protein
MAAIEELIDALKNCPAHRLKIPGELSPGGIMMTATAKFTGDRANIDTALRAETDLELLRSDLSKEESDLNTMYRARVIDKTISVLSAGAGGTVHLGCDTH